MGSVESVEGTLTRTEADARIQGYKDGDRQLRHYGGFNPNDLIENNMEAQQMINKLLIPQFKQL
ncbi:MAG: hypothetical protein EZS28_045790, partial [Streblomastix strix]